MVHVYADDGIMIVVDKASSLRDSEPNQTDLDSIYDWSVINQLPLSDYKSYCLHIDLKNDRLAYIL